jgi:hypothetical protein
LLELNSEDKHQQPNDDQQANQEDDADGAAEKFQHGRFLSRVPDLDRQRRAKFAAR